MNDHPITFFYCSNNNIFKAQQETCFLSLNYTSQPKYTTYSGGIFMYEDPLENIRRSIALFSVRSLPKSNWKNSNDVYIGREDE
jgi:hypothetical protein